MLEKKDWQPVEEAMQTLSERFVQLMDTAEERWESLTTDERIENLELVGLLSVANKLLSNVEEAFSEISDVTEEK